MDHARAKHVAMQMEDNCEYSMNEPVVGLR